MKDARNELFIGISITVATLIVVVGILFLQQSTIFAEGLRVRMVVEDASGIGKGSEVHFRGVRAGTVTGMEVGREQVTLQLRIQEVTEIPRDSRFVIGTQSLLGGKAVQIEPGDSEELLSNGAVVEGSAGGGLSQLTSQISSQLGGMDQQLTGVLENLNALLGEETRSELQAMLRESRNAADEVERTFAENREELERSITALRQLTEESRAPLTSTLEQLEAGTEELDSTMARLRDLSVRLDLMLQKIDRGEGTAGRVMEDEQLYVRLTRSLEELEALMKDIKENPDKYMTIKIF